MLTFFHLLQIEKADDEDELNSSENLNEMYILMEKGGCDLPLTVRFLF